MLSVSAVDPTFNGGQAVVVNSPPAALDVIGAGAVAVQSDGKIIVVGETPPVSGISQVAIRRFNSNGSLDTTFGVGGEASLPLPQGSYDTSFLAADLMIQPLDGKFVFSISLEQAQYNTPQPTYSNVETAVYRVNPNGSADTTFGTNGVTIISANAASLTRAALQADGKILLGGVANPTGSSLHEIALTRLNTDGSVDTGFNSGNLLILNPATYGEPVTSLTNPLAMVQTTAAGRVALVWSVATNISYGSATYNVVELNADGTPYTTFGANGLVQGNPNPGELINVATIEADGKFVLAGHLLTRLNADGSVDSTLTRPSLSFPVSSIIVQADGKILLGSNTVVARYRTNGETDGSYGPSGQASLSITPLNTNAGVSEGVIAANIALDPNGQVVTTGSIGYYQSGVGSLSRPQLVASQFYLARLKSSVPVAGDYDGDGKADIAAELTANAFFAYRKTTGGDVVGQFGQPGIGASIPAPGDYDGDGKTDVAVYLPALGVLAYRSSATGADVLTPFGPAGIGASIPAPGDYEGDGKTDIAVYIPALGAFAVHPSNGTANYLVPFGTPGVGASIPAPGDYDGDGKTDFAVYLTATGTLAYRSSATGNDVLHQFGSAGVGKSIPVPGDYDGDGKTDIAVYLPAYGSYAIQLSSGRGTAIVSFGRSGTGQSIPAPGDYDGDGVTDLAVYLPSTGTFAYRSSAGFGDVLQGFGAAGVSQTIPASSIPAAQPLGYAGLTASSSSSSPAVAAAAVYIPLTEDVIDPTSKPRKKTVGS